jgi:hypothetical protein
MGSVWFGDFRACAQTSELANSAKRNGDPGAIRAVRFADLG